MRDRVLIVDDDAIIRASLRKVLEEENYAVVDCADGETAKVHSAREQIDLVLLDLNLSNENGWNVFDELTRRDPFTPVIIITGMAHQLLTARMAGAGAILEKPIEADALLKIMAELLAEPKEKALSRLSGYSNDTRHIPPSGKLSAKGEGKRAANFILGSDQESAGWGRRH